MKRVGLILLVAVAALAVYQLKGRPHETEPTASAEHVTPGTWVITPSSAQTTNTLEVRCTDVEPAPEVSSCRWFKNGEVIEGETSTSLNPGHARRGDEVSAEVTAADGAAPVRTAPVRIVNSPPRITAASADLRTTPSAAVYVQVSVADADRDDIKLSYQWYRNGNPMPDQTGASVSVANFQMGDEVYATVTANDGTESSAPEKSDPIKIGSNAPDITSSPPASLQAGNRFVYQVQVRAAQPKTLRYQLVDAPEGMTIDESGLVEWTMPALDPNVHVYEVAIKVSDKTGGEAVQRFQLSASVQHSGTGE